MKEKDEEGQKPPPMLARTRMMLAAVFPIIGGAAVLYPSPGFTATVGVFVGVAVTAWVIAGLTTPPWSVMAIAVFFGFAAAAIAWWVPDWLVPWQAPWGVLAFAWALWLVPILATIPRREDAGDVEEDAAPDVPAPRPIIVRSEGPGFAYGCDEESSRFDYPEEDRVVRRGPPEGWVPRSATADGGHGPLVFFDDEPDEEEPDSGAEVSLRDRLLKEWPDPKRTKGLHIDEVVELLGLPADRPVKETRGLLEEAGVPTRDRVGKQRSGRSISKPGVHIADLLGGSQQGPGFTTPVTTG